LSNTGLEPHVEKRTLVIVGGGSAYTPGLLLALIRYQDVLQLDRVRLFDLDHDALEVVSALGAKMALAAGGKLLVEASQTLDAALRDADVVLNSSRPGGFDGRRLDETIALELDIPGQETVGPGGFFFALRSVPEALKLERAIAEIAPNAILLNYTNPTNIVTQALCDAGATNVIGLCDQSDEDLHSLALALGQPYDPQTARFACVGLNHATWYSQIQLSGEVIDSLLPGQALDPPAVLDREHQIRFEISMAMARSIGGGWPNSYLAYYAEPRRFCELARQQGVRSDRIVATLPKYYAHFRDEAQKDEPELRHHRGTAGFGDLAVRALAALVEPEGRSLILNLPHTKTPQLDNETVAECRATLSPDTVKVDPVFAPPAALSSLIAELETYQRLTAAAATTGRGVVRALAANPLVPDVQTAEKLLARARERYGTALTALL
jgi:6-phospho-beta-glucosidase